MDYIFREYKHNDIEEAKLLAEMWNASDKNFPGGTTRGIEKTAEKIMERMERTSRLAIFVVEYNGKIIGYGDLDAESGQKDVALLPTLNAHPDHHGKGVGKGLILNILDRTITLGYKQLVLGTWAGNTKAVPLYKKTGFFWVPETNVFMRNFIPAILSFPLTKDFFKKHYWYQCFKRDLSVNPDEIDWNGVKAFIYDFEADGEIVRFVVDSQSHSITAVETDDLSVACFIGEETVPTELEHPVKWEVKDKKRPSKPLNVTLIAKGEEGIAINDIERFEVKEEFTLEKSFSVAKDIKPKEDMEPTHKITSTLLIEGEPIFLETGVKTVQPIAIEYSGQRMIPNKDKERVVVNLRNHLGYPVKGILYVDPHPDLKLDRYSAEFSIEPKSWTSCQFWAKLVSDESVKTKIYAKFSVERNGKEIDVSSKAQTIIFRPILFGGIMSYMDDDEKSVRLENDSLSVGVNLKGGRIYINEIDNYIGGQDMSVVGPPFPGWRIRQPTYEYKLKEKDGCISITIIAPSDTLPGMVVEKTLTLSGSPAIKVDHRIINNSTTTQKAKLMVANQTGSNGKWTLPTKNGLLHQVVCGWGMFPDGYQDLSKYPDDYTERWSAVERNGHVVGMVWGECEENEFWNPLPQLLFDLPEIPPQSCIDLEPMYIIAGDGSWRKARQYWQWLYQPSSVIERRPPIAHPVLEVGFEDHPLLITKKSTPAKIAISSNRGKKLNGQLTAECSGFDAKSAEISGIDRDNPYQQDVTAQFDDLTPRIESACFTLKTDLETKRFSSPVIIIGNGEKVKQTHESGKTFYIDNGFMALKFVPDFFGSLVSLERNGVNHLQTAYPEPKPLSFFNPWFGGIHPVAGWLGDQRFLKEKFIGETIMRIGSRGMEWTGFKVICDREHRDYRWLRLETEYQTFGGSNVIAIINRCINKTNASNGTEAGVAIWAQPGGLLDDLVIHYEHFEPLYEQAGSTNDQYRCSDHRMHGEYIAELECEHWVCAESKKTGEAIAVIGSSYHSRIFAFDIGGCGVSIMSIDWVSLEPNETRESITWLVFCDSVEQAKKYRAIGEIWELP